MTKGELLDRITRFFLESGDFNGFALSRSEGERRELEELLREGRVSINFGDRHPNPHVKALDPEPVEDQLRKLGALGLEGACAYPSAAHLAAVVDRTRYQDRPFTLRLYLGEPELRPYFFHLSILEIYRNDPRYWYRTDDISGMISIRGEHYHNGTMREADKVLLQTFGFGYNEQMDRAVGVYLRYLHDLSPEHQRIWEASRLEGKFMLHPDYWRATCGDWPERESTAIVEEMHHINEVSKRMSRPPFFREGFGREGRPKEFAFLLRPTLKELNSFVHLLDKMLSENINLEFFVNEVPTEEERPLGDGRVEVHRKGSIQILRDWLNQTVGFLDSGPKDEMIQTFGKIRKMPQKPAHAVPEDEFDQRYFRKQRELVIEAYQAVRTLRLILTNHPAVHDYEVPEWLRKGEIWTY